MTEVGPILKNELLTIDTHALAQYIRDHVLQNEEDLSESSSEELPAEELLQLPEDEESAGHPESEDASPDSTEEPYPFTTAKFALMIPPDTPPSALLAHIIQGPDTSLSVADQGLDEEVPSIAEPKERQRPDEARPPFVADQGPDARTPSLADQGPNESMPSVAEQPRPKILDASQPINLLGIPDALQQKMMNSFNSTRSKIQDALD
jgi:hypothetical protein